MFQPEVSSDRIHSELIQRSRRRYQDYDDYELPNKEVFLRSAAALQAPEHVVASIRVAFILTIHVFPVQSIVYSHYKI